MYPIYLDYAATTPVDPRVIEKMYECLSKPDLFGNPSSLHYYGHAARDLIEIARAQIAAVMHADASEIIWTSGATESINLAIKGAAQLYQRKGKHIVTLKTEHKATLDSCQHLEKKGYHVTYFSPLTNGAIDVAAFADILRDDTVLVSLMHVNNETGFIQDLAAIAEITSARGILLHVDAAQTIGKAIIDTRRIPVDLISLSAHKVYGPKGVGALYLRKKPRVRVEPLLHGGGHEQGMRSGTLPTQQMIGMGEAFRLAQLQLTDDVSHAVQLRHHLLAGLASVKNMVLNSELNSSVPHIVNLRFEGMLADAILAQLPMLAASTGAACQGRGVDGSYVLRALGLSTEQARSSLRLSFGRFTTLEEIDKAAQSIKYVVSR